ncbi:MAG: hypothetical protein HY280_03425 [Nitrospinae bacterium]|nr:hypothetical protein [Nitrospinota bacterium]
MFFGNYPATLDEKGRVHIPSVLARDVGDNETVMVADWGKCLAAFPQKAFEEMGKVLMEQSKSKQHRERVHRIVSNFYPSVLKNGKLLVPQELRERKKLDRKISVVGMLTHIEIWNQKDWNEKDAGSRKKSIRDDLDELGIL